MLGGRDTIPINFEWALTEVICNLEIMNNLIELWAGISKCMNQIFPILPYLHTIVKKTFHLHPPGPMTLGHVNVKDVQILHYKILANMCGSEYMGYWS
jgi:hypothetical protein